MPTTIERLVIESLLFVIAACDAAHAADVAPPVGGRMRLVPPPGATVAEDTPATFGVVFRPGEVAKGKTIKARLDGAVKIAKGSLRAR